MSPKVRSNTNQTKPGRSTSPPRSHAGYDGHEVSSIKAMPYSLDAEQGAIGAMMMDTKAIIHVQDTLTAKDFYNKAHRIAFDAITGLHDRDEPVDMITVAEEIRRHGRLDDAGGAEYLASLLAACPSAASIASYARIVAEKSARREAIRHAEALKAAAYDTGNPDLLTGELARAAHLAEMAGRGEKRRFTLVTGQQLEEQPELPMLIAKVLPMEAVAVIVGKFGTYKTFLALGMAFALTNGMAWHGLSVQQRGVVYVAAEGSRGMKKRLRALVNRHQCPMPTNLYFVTEPVQLSNPGEVEALIREIKRLPYPVGLIVFDTLARCLVGGDENSARDMGLLIDGADRIRKQTGATVLLVHHVGKDGSTRGSTALPGGVETIVRVDRSRDENHLITISCEKQKDAEEFEKRAFRLRVVELYDDGANHSGGNTSLVLEAAELAEESETTADTSNRTVQTMLNVLSERFPNGVRAGEWQSACSEYSVKRSTFYNHRDALMTAGRIVQVGSLYFVDGNQQAENVRPDEAPMPAPVLEPQTSPNSPLPLGGCTAGLNSTTVTNGSSVSDQRATAQIRSEPYTSALQRGEGCELHV